MIFKYLEIDFFFKAHILGQEASEKVLICAPVLLSYAQKRPSFCTTYIIRLNDFNIVGDIVVNLVI